MESEAIYSVGHSNQGLEAFISLLQASELDCLVDVRSQPSSKWSPQFNLAPLRRAVIAAGLRFEYAGNTLGGRPQGSHFYDANGHVDYAAVSRAPFFIEGI